MKKKILSLAFISAIFVSIGYAQTWTQKNSHTGAARYNYSGFAVNGKGYFGGGNYAGPFNAISGWNEFDPAMNTWSLISAMPSPFTGLSAFEIGGAGYVVDGVNDATFNYDTYKYNVLGNNWATETTFPNTRLYAASIGNGQKGYVIGGYDVMTNPMCDLWEYNPLTNLWVQRDSLPVAAARYNATAFSVGTEIYVFGGLGTAAYLNDLWQYNPNTNLWAQKTSMPAAGRESSLSFVVGTDAYIIGGVTSSGLANAEVWKYSSTTDTWIQLTSFPGSNLPYGGTAWTINGKGYIVPANGTTECWEFTPGTVSSENMEKKNSLTLFPNPAYDKLFICSENNKIDRVEVNDVNGKMILSFNLSSELHEPAAIDIRSLPAGYYFLNAFTNQNQRYTKSFVK